MPMGRVGVFAGKGGEITRKSGDYEKPHKAREILPVWGRGAEWTGRR
jgi:hypothetical protein